MVTYESDGKPPTKLLLQRRENENEDKAIHISVNEGGWATSTYKANPEEEEARG